MLFATSECLHLEFFYRLNGLFLSSVCEDLIIVL